MTNNRYIRYTRRILALMMAALLILVLNRGMKGALAMFSWLDGSDVETVLDERFDIGGVNQIALDASSLTVEIRSTSDDQARLVFQSNLSPEKRAQLAVERNGDTFTIEQLKHIRIGLFINVRERLTLYLPIGYRNALSLRLRSGNLTMSDARTFTNLSANLTSGNLEIGDIATETYSVHASSGNITLGNWNGEGRLQVTSGNIRLHSLTGTSHEIHSTSGTIRIGSLSGDTTLHVGSGTIRVERFEGQGSFSSTSGSVNVGIESITGDISLHCVSGAIRATVPGTLAFHFEGETLSGSVKTDFTSTRNGRSVTATVGVSPDYTLRCNTTSGSIRVGYH